ncbi:uncharacterized protein B0H18DRAFT_960361 [Fomitopsis serialis]|uniref:uncharacterized protein n=1 Tax=Fomitopsis serialis TaxID=139415 RepID=UPI0020076071|nr:uncharacterized protein B0H18DRAFT_960361 [Neoantrodia serialis]KAH9913449.1 hypothetical protein B0H18DRAFT_960361 [Neoantrodia serialis]
MSGFRCRASNVGRPMSGVRCRASDVGRPMSDAQWFLMHVVLADSSSPFNIVAMAVPTAQDYDDLCYNYALPSVKGAAVGSKADGSTPQMDDELVKSMVIHDTASQHVHGRARDWAQAPFRREHADGPGITDAMARFWDIVGGREESGKAALSRLGDIVVPKAIREPDQLIQVPPDVAWTSAKHAVEEGTALLPPDGVSLSAFRTEVRDTLEAEASRVDAINEMLEVQIAECEGDHTARDRAENRYNQEAKSPGYGQRGEGGTMHKVLTAEEEIEFLRECVTALQANFEYMEEYISAEIRFWDSALAANERNLDDWYAREAEHPVMEDTEYFTHDYTEFRSLDDM